MLRNSIPKPNFLLSKIVDLKDLAYASLVFNHLTKPNIYAFNVMLRGLATTWKKYDFCVELYYKLKSFGLKANNFTYPFLFIACGNVGGLVHGKIGHCLVFKTGLDGDEYVNHSLITMYARCGEMGFAKKVFDEMGDRGLVSWNSMISGYSKMGFAKEATLLFMEMREEGVEPDEMTLVSVLGACGDLGDLGLGRWVDWFVVDKKMEVNSYVGSALIDMYGKCGDLISARRVFDSCQTRMCAQNGASNEAIVLFNEMREAGPNPDKVTMIEVLSACSTVGALDLGKWVETHASERGLQHDVYVASALIDMYAKCGSLDDALRVFESMPHKNEVSWNAMISALAFHGQAQEALSLFRRMSKDNDTVHPNDITFIGVLSACVHAGLVDEGRQLFESMSLSFGLVPKVEHYSCMVDLCARAGLLYEAWDLIKKMPGKPDEIVLGSLLGACQRCRNADVGERVIELFLKMELSNSGNYVISSKIYANMKRWDDCAKMRVLMRQCGVSKTPGCSWIDIGARVHEFHAGDSLQHHLVIIYQLLNEEMKREGYVPNTDCI
ncbi:pentatricopeptide repeat-containing family protein [Salix suchowensis]|nr:pentatricopeptide repeat-containing family protein [Salix suchowensis]